MIRMHVRVFAAVALFSASAFAQETEEMGANWGGEGGKMAAGEVSSAGTGQSGKAIYEDLLKVDDQAAPEGTPVVWARLFPVAQKWEVSAGFEMSVIDKYTKHMGGKLNFTYHLDELLALNLYGGYLHGQPTSLMINAQDVSRNAGGSNTCNPNGDDPETLRYCLPDTNSMSWMVGADFMAEPFYGKLNLVSELALNFDIFVGAGLGVTGRKGFATDPSTVEVFHDANRNSVTPYVTAVAGVRVWVLKNVALRVEARDYTMQADRGYLELNLPSMEQSDVVNVWTMMFGLGVTL